MESVTTTSAKRKQLIQSLSDKSYRDAFVAAEIETTIPFQIKALRKARAWNQQQLADAAKMTQARISVLENPDYEGSMNVKTLEKLASVFDVGLIVRFAPFSEIVDWTNHLTAKKHAVPTYANDEGLRSPSSASCSINVATAWQSIISADSGYHVSSTIYTIPIGELANTFGFLGTSEPEAHVAKVANTQLAKVA
jgi:transcriptional regulator with XRE-family HTH domain